MGKKTAVLAGIFLLGFLGWKIYDRMEQNQQAANVHRPPTRAVAVAVAPLERKDLQRRRVFTGTLKPSLFFDVAPRVGGRIIEMPASMGDAVHPGDLLVRLDDQDYRLEYDQLKAEVDVARARRDAQKTATAARKKEFDRAKTLAKKNMISDAQYDDAETAYKMAVENEKVAQAQLRQGESRLRLAEVRLQDCLLRVPQGEKMGIRTLYVGSSYVELGALVKANEPLLSLMDIHALKGQFYITEKDYALVHPDMEAFLQVDAYPGRSFPAQVERISFLVQEESRQALVELAVPNEELLLRPGMFMRAEVVLEEKLQALAAPLDALCEREGERGIFLVDSEGKRASFQKILPGIQDEGMAEILEPKELEGLVVTLGHHLLGAGGGDVLIPQTSSPPEDASSSEEKKSRETP
jgi:RND family efflux transporter MFP subunit